MPTLQASRPRQFSQLRYAPQLMTPRKLAARTRTAEKTSWPWSVGIRPHTTHQAAAALISRALDGRGAHVLTLNLDIYAQLRTSPSLRERLLDDIDFIVADGMPIRWASALAGSPLPERVTGADLLPVLTEQAVAQELRVHFSGGEGSTSERTAAIFSERHRKAHLLTSSAYSLTSTMTSKQLDAIAAPIVRTRPNVIFLAYGFPKQDLLAQAIRRSWPKSVVVGCGAAFDFAVGHFQRAPLQLRESGLEWLHRLALDPKRLTSRYLLRDAPALPPLIGAALQERCRKRLSIRKTTGR